MLQAEYDRLGMNKTAKATDIVRHLNNVVSTRYIDECGKKQNGYKLLNKK